MSDQSIDMVKLLASVIIAVALIFAVGSFVYVGSLYPQFVIYVVGFIVFILIVWAIYIAINAND